MAGNSHIIHRVNLEIDVPEMRLANQVKEDAVRLIYNEILPKLEKYLDTLVPIDEHIQLNQLNINLENISVENFEKEFSTSLFQLFHEKTEKLIEPLQLANDQPDDEKVITFTREQSALESFLYFLETGRLPWWSEKSGELLHEQNLSQILSHSAPEFQERLISLLIENDTALERLLNQYSLPFIFQNIFPVLFSSPKALRGFVEDKMSARIISLLQKLFERKKTEGYLFSKPQQVLFKRIISQIVSQKGVFSAQQLKNILDEFSADFTFPDAEDQQEFKLLINEIRLNIKSEPVKNQQDLDFQDSEKMIENQEKGISKTAKKHEEEEEGIFVDNAGLVLLHPFLSSFFADFELLADGKFKDIESQTTAVHLLHYLASKQELAPEYELITEKFLCGWDLDLPIAREVTLSIEMKNESEALLKAAIKHWSALKNTSPDGLREGFLQREGKLILNDFQDRLIIESKAQDVLLSFLPWGYSIFKLPWMKNALYVEWQ
ncbi:MAG: contractile injection system tape measure protein [Bacteroidota bacterium]|nr:contractile injection system tape measure protein [Bacteroidota bacterium]